MGGLAILHQGQCTHLLPCIRVTGLIRLCATLLVALAKRFSPLSSPLLLIPAVDRTHFRRRTKSPTLLSALPPGRSYSRCLHKSSPSQNQQERLIDSSPSDTLFWVRLFSFCSGQNVRVPGAICEARLAISAFYPQVFTGSSLKSLQIEEQKHANCHINFGIVDTELSAALSTADRLWRDLLPA